ncbi:hypothetical protein EDB81DRAFT_773482 [Dactylonectria macrodidyma]|uniref:Zn(2)-C6 fungal-type domain-containing protein n=1 Tax=Dactylonectria macrodidyma TaxID=307937 RepID=A0A9P9JJB2_9HYPO|nr:hypothetical protein EDB81DRAFT_773482 [Dactylonectria macrodidyma]
MHSTRSSHRAGPRSDQACGACKTKKRKCDKALPECGLCRRMGRGCDYGEAQDHPPTASEFAAMRARLGELESRLAAASSSLTVSSESRSSPGGANRSIYGSEILDDATVRTGFGLEADSVASSSQSRSQVHTNNDTRSINSEALSHSRPNIEPPVPLFLDIDFFVWFRYRLPASRLAIPMDVLELLGHGNAVVDTCRDYFATIHTWMPFISKKRLDLGISIQSGGPDLAMLFLAMRLVIAQAHEVADGKLYSLAKGFMASLESDGVISLFCLQAKVLLALYEYSHAMYPAAWMSVGACSRYSEMLGLASVGERVLLGQPTTWTGIEERRRVWWSIFILDRLISMGNRKSFSSPEPSFDSRLPDDDGAWDTGDVLRATSASVSTDYKQRQPAFARLCQASIYVSRAIVIAQNPNPTSDSQVAKTMALIEELKGFSQVVDSQAGLPLGENGLSLLAPRCVARSALFVALDVLSCPMKVGPEPGYNTSSFAKTPTELKLQFEAIQALQEASEDMHRLAVEVSIMLDVGESLPGQLGKVPPFMLDVMYCACASFHWFLSESGSAAFRASIENLDNFFLKVGQRWRLSEKYREITKLHDVAARIGDNQLE